ncbi:hypothetical protein Tco_0766096 [Tanacetum coccineum]
MTCNMSYLSDFKEFDGGYVTFGGGAKGGRITGKGTLKTGNTDFEDVYQCQGVVVNLLGFTDVWIERISKKRTKNEAKTTKPDTEWKSVKKTQSSPSPKEKKEIKRRVKAANLAKKYHKGQSCQGQRDGSKEAQLLSMAGIKTLKSLTEEKHLARAEDLACSINRTLVLAEWR